MGNNLIITTACIVTWRFSCHPSRQLLTKRSFLGEWGIGTNYGITKFTKDMLFDEKIGGTIHLAVGASYPETGGKNDSALHWDMLCDMADSEVTVDNELFYKDGKIMIK